MPDMRKFLKMFADDISEELSEYKDYIAKPLMITLIVVGIAFVLEALRSVPFEVSVTFLVWVFSVKFLMQIKMLNKKLEEKELELQRW